MKKYLGLAFCIGLFLSLSAQVENLKYYSVASPTKMNVVYAGVDNPVDIMVEGLSHDKVTVTISGGGTISSAGPYKYTINPSSDSKTITLLVVADINGKKVNAGTHEFRVKRIADPVAVVGGFKGGKISKNVLLAQTKVDAVIENFDFDLNFTIVGFSVSAVIGEYSQDATSTSALISSQQKTIIENLNPGDKVYFENIRAKGPDGTLRPMGSIIFEIE